MAKCTKCDNNFENNEEIILTDYFGVFKEPVLVCKGCFIKQLLSGIEGYEPGHCDHCNRELVPDTDIDLDEGSVWFYCPGPGDEHSSIGEYLVQPEEDYD
ncbi:hypothetical protein [Paenibacillus sp. NRS-1760]|uniref:hypothetical protein n=1 Tax=Paenibacillus sp. NRS-1760 TaxID=3233902 RepID=UPI003D2E4456